MNIPYRFVVVLILFVVIPDKKLSSTPNATSESYEGGTMKSTPARLEGILNFNAH